VIDAEQCMTGFDLPNNLNPNPERIGRIIVVHNSDKKPTKKYIEPTKHKD
jgi:hypothetical protein